MSGARVESGHSRVWQWRGVVGRLGWLGGPPSSTTPGALRCACRLATPVAPFAISLSPARPQSTRWVAVKWCRIGHLQGPNGYESLTFAGDVVRRDPLGLAYAHMRTLQGAGRTLLPVVARLEASSPRLCSRRHCLCAGVCAGVCVGVCAGGWLGSRPPRPDSARGVTVCMWA